MKRCFWRYLSITLATVTGLCANWPQFRGPNTQGKSEELGLPLKWSSSENILWKTELPGEGWSSPIVWGNHVFVTAADDGGASCRVIAVDKQTGRILWNREVFRQVPGHKQPRNSYATPTPVTDGKFVYACFYDGSFAALDFDGNVAWTNRAYPFYSEHGLATSPIVFEGLLIMARDGSSEGPDKSLGWQKPWDKSFVLALETATGRERWKSYRGLSRIGHGSPAIWTAPDGHVELVTETGDVLQGYNPRNGDRLWSSEVIGEGKVPSVVLSEDMAFTAGGWGGRESIKAFRLGGRGDLKETNLVWEQRKGMPKVPSMLYLRPYLYAVTDAGLASCFKATTGEIIWQQRLPGTYSASPMAAEGRIYFTSDNGETVVIQEGAEFKILSRNPLGEKVQASPAISDKTIFIRSTRHLFAIKQN
ncbi:MAG: PQQ-binding-like beta-propeller repeat protein [Verrucomicrobiae bacterium]|nr:PQQ-binding-like beta-propeller repeat protein [Verrucomicrobiae bacterium]